MAAKVLTTHLVVLTILLYSSFPAQVITAQNPLAIKPDVTQSQTQVNHDTLSAGDTLPSAIEPTSVRSSLEVIPSQSLLPDVSTLPSETEVLQTSYQSGTETVTYIATNNNITDIEPETNGHQKTANQQNITATNSKQVTESTDLPEAVMSQTENNTLNEMTTDSHFDNGSLELTAGRLKNSNVTMQSPTELNKFNQTTNEQIFTQSENSVPDHETTELPYDNVIQTTTADNGIMVTDMVYENITNVRIKSDRMITNGLTEATTAKPRDFKQKGALVTERADEPTQVQGNGTKTDFETVTSLMVFNSTEDNITELKTFKSDINVTETVTIAPEKSENVAFQGTTSKYEYITEELRLNNETTSFTESPVNATEPVISEENDLDNQTGSSNVTLYIMENTINVSGLHSNYSTTIATKFNNTIIANNHGNKTVTESPSLDNVRKTTENNTESVTQSLENVNEDVTKTMVDIKNVVESVTQTVENVTKSTDNVTETEGFEVSVANVTGSVENVPTNNVTIPTRLTTESLFENMKSALLNETEDTFSSDFKLRNFTEVSEFDNVTSVPALTSENVGESAENGTVISSQNVTVTTDLIQDIIPENVAGTQMPYINQTLSEQNVTSKNVTDPTSVFSNVTSPDDNFTMVTPIMEFQNVTDTFENKTTIDYNLTQSYENVTSDGNKMMDATTPFYGKSTESVTFSDYNMTTLNHTEIHFLNETLNYENETSYFGNTTKVYDSATTTDFTFNFTESVNITESTPINVTIYVNVTKFEHITGLVNVSMFDNFTVNATESLFNVTPTIFPEKVTTTVIGNYTTDNVTIEITTVTPQNITLHNVTESVKMHNTTVINITESLTTKILASFTSDNVTDMMKSYEITSDNVTVLVTTESPYNATDFNDTDTVETNNVSFMNVTDFKIFYNITSDNVTEMTHTTNVTHFDNVIINGTDFNFTIENITEEFTSTLPMVNGTSADYANATTNSHEYITNELTTDGDITAETSTFSAKFIGNFTELTSEFTFLENMTTLVPPTNVTDSTSMQTTPNTLNFTNVMTIEKETSDNVTERLFTTKEVANLTTQPPVLTTKNVPQEYNSTENLNVTVMETQTVTNLTSATDFHGTTETSVTVKEEVSMTETASVTTITTASGYVTTELNFTSVPHLVITTRGTGATTEGITPEGKEDTTAETTVTEVQVQITTEEMKITESTMKEAVATQSASVTEAITTDAATVEQTVRTQDTVVSTEASEFKPFSVLYSPVTWVLFYISLKFYKTRKFFFLL